MRYYATLLLCVMYLIVASYAEVMTEDGSRFHMKVSKPPSIPHTPAPAPSLHFPLSLSYPWNASLNVYTLPSKPVQIRIS